MIAHRQIYNIKGSYLTIEIPPEIKTNQVEIIILGLDESNIESDSSNNKNEDFSKPLLTAKTLTSEELKKWKNIIKKAGKWKFHKKYFERIKELIKQ